MMTGIPDKPGTSPEWRKLTQHDVAEFVLERFSDVKKSKKSKDLVHFHTINKYLLMACGPKNLNLLGNLVANHEKLEIDVLLSKYEDKLNETMQQFPSKKSHSNTLYHIFGHFSKDLSKEEKKYFLKQIDDYTEGRLGLSDTLISLKEWTSKFDKTYLARQTYFLLYIE